MILGAPPLEPSIRCYRWRMTETTADIRIERIHADQGLLLRRLRLDSLAQSPEAFGQPLAEARARPEVEWHRSARQSSHGDNRTWLFAQRGQETLGLVQGRKRRPSTLMLFSMWIEAGARRQGLGSLLIADLEQWGLGWGAKRTLLWVYRWNQNALRFYRDLGFEVMLDGDDAVSGARFEALAMQREITPVLR